MLNESTQPKPSTQAPKVSRRTRSSDQKDKLQEISLIARTAQAAITNARSFAGDAEIIEVALTRRGVKDSHLWRVRYTSRDPSQ